MFELDHISPMLCTMANANDSQCSRGIPQHCDREPANVAVRARRSPNYLSTSPSTYPHNDCGHAVRATVLSPTFGCRAPFPPTGWMLCFLGDGARRLREIHGRGPTGRGSAEGSVSRQVVPLRRLDLWCQRWSSMFVCRHRRETIARSKNGGTFFTMSRNGGRDSWPRDAAPPALGRVLDRASIRSGTPRVPAPRPSNPG